MYINPKKHLMIVIGTRPEFIKVSPLVRLLRKNNEFRVTLCSTGQHREMLGMLEKELEINLDVDLNIMSANQTLNGLFCRVMASLDAHFKEDKPDMVLVHGDTTTSFAAAMTAFNSGIAIAHIEAGLRTWDLQAPWPEEANRHLTSVIADLQFAPTDTEKDNLIRENVDSNKIIVTGNTCIDSLLWIRDRLSEIKQTDIDQAGLGFLKKEDHVILMTSHRRENFGKSLNTICQSILKLAKEFPNYQFVYPVHLNPRVQNTVHSLLSNISNIHLIPPLNYTYFIWLMNRSEIILTDSGGVQEEAPALGKPVLVLREVTERPQALETNNVVLVGTDQQRIYEMVSNIINDDQLHSEMSHPVSPYGDGKASKKIINAVIQWFNR